MSRAAIDRLRRTVMELKVAIEHIREDRRCGLEPYPETYDRAIAKADAALEDEDGREPEIRDR